MASITVILVSHNKPRWLPEAVDSVLSQTFPDWQLILVDSGVLWDQGYFACFPFDWRTQLVRTGETEEDRKTKALAPWCFNQAYRRGLIASPLVCYLSDDDIFYANAFGTFVEFFQARPDAMAMYASQDFGSLYADGRREWQGERLANHTAGSCVGGVACDCQIDMGQLCHRTDLFRLYPVAWPEAKGHGETHADGLFMESIGLYVPIYPHNVKVGCNRKVPESRYSPTC